MLKTFLEHGAENRCVYITDVREAFQARGTRPFHLHMTLYNGSVRTFPLLLPVTQGREEEDFVAEYVHASVYNLLSALGGVRLDIYMDREDRTAWSLAEGLGRTFQLSLPKSARTGYGRCLNVNERVLTALFQGKSSFSFGVHSITEEPDAEAHPTPAGRPVFSGLPALTAGRMLLGMDVGGTDVKLAAIHDRRQA